MVIETIKFSQMTAGGDLGNDDKTPGLLSGANVLFNNPWTFLAPGTTAQRPAPSTAINYRLRFNTDDQLYEYYDAVLAQWIQLQENFFTTGPFVTYAASAGLPDAFDLGTLTNGILKQTVSTGISTPAIALVDVDYYGPGMVGYMQQPAGVKDVNGNKVVDFVSTASAVNFVALVNNATGQVPQVRAAGTDPNVGLLLVGKGNGGIGFSTTNTTVPFNFYSGTGAQHTTNFAMADTATNRTATWQDSDGTVAWLSDVMGTVTSLTGTQFQVLVNGTFGSAQFGNLTLTLPQNIDATASPTFNNLQLNGGQIKDANGNVILNLLAGANAVNYVSLSNDGTGLPAIIQALGSDPNIGFAIGSKGDAGIGLNTSAVSAVPIQITSGTAAQHQTNFLFSNTAQTRNVTFQDADGTLAYLANIPAGSPSALTKVDDTNVTLTLGGTPATALLQAVSLTLGWTGTLSPTRGGTGVNNASNTLTLAGNLATSGAFASTFTMTGATGVTFPTSGTLATTGQLPTPAALTKVDDTNVTLTLGGTPATSLLQAVSVTAGWTGQLSLTRGGTNNSLTASAGGIVWSDASKLNILGGTSTANQILLSGNAATPAWSTTTYPATNAINTIMYASSANVLGVITPVNSAVLVSSSGGVPSMGTTLPNINIGTPTAGVLTNTTGGGGLRSFQIFITGTAATYTKPANVTSILVEAVGAGGGGGGITAEATTIAVGAGGGGGGYCRKYYSASASTYTYTVGAGGAGGIGANNGANGGNTTFDVMTAGGGGGGVQGTAGGAAVSAIAQGGSGGLGTGGDLGSYGGAGGYGLLVLTNTASGAGGSSQFSGMTPIQTATTGNGLPGFDYGQGGGGALGGLSGGTTQNGGAGAAGLIIVWEFS